MPRRGQEGAEEEPEGTGQVARCPLEQVPFPGLHKGAVGAGRAVAKLSEAESEVTEGPMLLQIHVI